MEDPNLTASDRRRSPRGRCVPALGLLLLMLLFLPDRAQAYVDPGTGTMVWQMLVAGFLGAIFYLRRLIPGLRPKRKQPSVAGDQADGGEPKA